MVLSDASRIKKTRQSFYVSSLKFTSMNHVATISAVAMFRPRNPGCMEGIIVPCPVMFPYLVELPVPDTNLSKTKPNQALGTHAKMLPSSLWMKYEAWNTT
jgi:hypothetical protein